MKRLAIAALLIPLAAHADRLAGDAVICLNKSSMNELIVAAHRGDERGITHQFATKSCRRITDKPDVSVIGFGRNDMAHVRIYWDDGSQSNAWTLINYVGN